MKLGTKITITIALSCLICTLAAVAISSKKVNAQGELQLIQKSQAILTRLEALRKFIATQGNLQDEFTEIVKKYPDGKLDEAQRQKTLRKVPIVASMQVGFDDAHTDHYTFRVFSDEPRREENRATASELEILKKFEADGSLKELTTDTADTVTVYRPVYLLESQGCLLCHGHPSTSPWGNGKDILGYRMENWSDGKLHGAFAIITSKSNIKEAAANTTYSILGLSSIISLVIVGLSYLFIRGPLNQVLLALDKLTDVGTQVASTGGEIRISSQNLSEASVRAAASLEETSASTEEVSSMVRLNTQNAAQARDLAMQATEKAKIGEAEVQKLTNSMNDISQSSKRIEEIITVIDDIAFQTNLLALNASVEAARAGDHGKGFAVVAEAVRSLATRSATSAKEISSLIGASVQDIDKGRHVVKSSEASLKEIVITIEQLSSLNTDISNACSEQEQGITQINRALAEMDKITQANAAAAEECATASETIASQSVLMSDEVDHLNKVVNGN